MTKSANFGCFWMYDQVDTVEKKGTDNVNYNGSGGGSINGILG